MANEYNDKYLEFASKVSFFEFIQEEFKQRSFNTSDYLEEIKGLESKDKWDIDGLTDFMVKHPRSFEIFEEIFQLVRFTNTQLVHFLFNTDILNSVDNEGTVNYLKKNLKFDRLFADIFIKQSKKTDIYDMIFKNVEHILYFIDNNKDQKSMDYVTFLFKATVITYVKYAIKKVEIMHERLSNSSFQDVAERIAKYLILNLHLNEILKSYNIEEYLENKMIPGDTKAIHGNFGKIKICQILERHNFINADSLFYKNNIKSLNSSISNEIGLKELQGKFAFVTEKYVDGINKRKDGKPKLFDFVLLHDLKPKVVIETNFYSTSGTKIGINQGEYADLNEDIKKEHSDLIFIWITDGNYWLMTDGKNRLLNLYNYFGDNILNYNFFNKKLEKLKEKIGNI